MSPVNLIIKLKQSSVALPDSIDLNEIPRSVQPYLQSP